jgi:IS1 family transposase
LEQTLAPAAQREEEVLELDEVWSFVRQRKNKRWIWLALCRRTRQVVAYAIGNRGGETCRLLWERVPESYRRGILYSDFWESYQKVLPEDQHQPVGKSSGQTNLMWSAGTALCASVWDAWLERRSHFQRARRCTKSVWFCSCMTTINSA